MKKLTLTLSILFLMIFHCFGQDLLDPGKKWINSWGTWGTGGPPPYFMHSNICRIDTNGTMINDHNYFKLMYTADSLGLQWTDYGYIRETASGKVYYVPSLQDTVQRLCYDFGAGVGDTLTIYTIAFGYTQSVTVEAVDSVFFAGKMRKRVLVGDEWISGVGSTFGFIYNGWFVVGATYRLSCYFENEVLLYHYQYFPTCFMEFTGVNKVIEKMKYNCQIVPNPVTGVSSISFNDDLINSGSGKFELFNILGETVAEYPVKAGLLLSNSDFTSGIYFYKVSKDSRVYSTGKIIIP